MGGFRFLIEMKRKHYVTEVVDEFLEDVDPDEERWNKADRAAMITELDTIVDGRVSDWRLATEKGEKLDG